MQVQKLHGVSLIYFMKGVFKMSKNEQTAAMYETIPAVAELNKVPGFNPFKLLRRIISPENGEEMMQLDLRYKKLWFRLANPKGRIRLNALRITEQLAIYEAQIFLERTDENPIGSFTSSCTKEDAPGGQYIQAAQQAAMDEALSDAGFGIQFADLNTGAGGSRYGSRIPLNGLSQAKEAAVPAGADTASAEKKQQMTAAAGSTVMPFPTTAKRTEIAQQEKPAQVSGLPVEDKKTTVNTGQEEKKSADNSPSQNTGTEAKTPLEVMAESGNPAMGLPAGPQSGPESLPVELPAKIQETALPAGTGEMPVKTAEPESLPIQAITEMSAAEKPGNVLPVSGRKDMEEDTRKAVQGMMALLGGQNAPAETAAVPSGENTEVAESNAADSETRNLPVTGQTQKETNARYTPDMPVEEIVKLMTFEEAGQVVVDTGVCKGQTIAEVAERRPPSLKFYLYGGYRGDNNILRAAAQIMLDSLAVKKAG